MLGFCSLGPKIIRTTGNEVRKCFRVNAEEKLLSETRRATEAIRLFLVVSEAAALRRLSPQVNEAEEERIRSEREHMRVTHACQEAEARVQTLQKSLKRVILKSKPYFELKSQLNHILEVR